MSERTLHHLDFRTGQVRVTTTNTDASDFGERVRGMATQMSDAIEGPVEEEWASVLCDVCGRHTAIDSRDPKLPDGWRTIDGLGDVCHLCQREDPEVAQTSGKMADRP